MGRMNDPQGEARARMEQAEKAARRAQEAREASAAGTPRRPQRYKLYDRIKDRVSVTTMNVIICATALMLILARIVGIATRNPQ